MDDDDVTPRLQCDIELDFPGPNDATLNKWAAAALRRLADRLEKEELDSGNHAVTDNVGKTIGTMCLSYYEEVTIP